MNSRPTQRQNALRWLREAGSRGIHSFELHHAFCMNPSQVIADLEARGHIISRERERLHGRAFGVRYRLEIDADDRRAA